MTYKKITSGFVIQKYNNEGTCIEQDFIAGDTVDYEDENGDTVTPNLDKEQYQPFNMIQPGFDYYILEMTGCVEPCLHGPFASKEDQDEVYQEFISDEQREEENSFAVFKITKGSEVII